MEHKLIVEKIPTNAGYTGYCSCFLEDDDQFFFGYEAEELHMEFLEHLEEQYD